jgi:hypothetical protein
MTEFTEFTKFSDESGFTAHEILSWAHIAPLPTAGFINPLLSWPPQKPYPAVYSIAGSIKLKNLGVVFRTTYQQL